MMNWVKISDEYMEHNTTDYISEFVGGINKSQDDILITSGILFKLLKLRRLGVDCYINWDYEYIRHEEENYMYLNVIATPQIAFKEQ